MPKEKIINKSPELIQNNKFQKTLNTKRNENASEILARKKDFTIVAIGASAGGLEAVTNLFNCLKEKTGMAYIYVQHLSPDHKSILTSILSKVTQMKVQDIEDMEKMEPDNVYVIPYNRDIEVTDGHIKLIPRPKSKSYNLSIDVLFSSLALTHKSNIIGIVLSGNASDGRRGLTEIKQAGGITMAQDNSAKFKSMPQSSIDAGVVDYILSPEEMAHKLMEISQSKELSLFNKESIHQDDTIDTENPDFNKILHHLFKKYNVDFSLYKLTTIRRRILRRLQLLKLTTVKKYAEFYLKNETESVLLFQDLLIHVTDFFRDTEAFHYLKEKVIPKLIKGKLHTDTIRVWIAGCSTGEEVYSIAMLFFEEFVKNNSACKIQLFASDLSEESIQEARKGEYFAKQLKHVSTQRISTFFSKKKDVYQINKAIRDVCIFAKHDILSDPPFSHMDLISCRNMLIYLDTAAQKKAINTFHYALNQGGYLFLGKSETIGSSTNLFSLSSKKHKLYCRKSLSVSKRIPEIITRISLESDSKKTSSIKPIPKRIFPNSNKIDDFFDALLLDHYIPASVVINYNLEIILFRGATSHYLKHGSGKASLNILKMVHIGLAFELRNAIQLAKKLKNTVRKNALEIYSDSNNKTIQLVNIEVRPLMIDGEEPLLVIVFTGNKIHDDSEHSKKGIKSYTTNKDIRIKKLEAELAAVRAEMGTITHLHEEANDELQIVNEEIVSSNEELQSLNEELETSKEEIESTNEELIISNKEMHVRVQQIEDLYNYYETILTTIYEPMLILNKKFKIISANKSFYTLFKTSQNKCIGNSFFSIGNNQWNISILKDLLDNLVNKNKEFHQIEVEQDFTQIGTKTLLLNAHIVVQPKNNEELVVLTMNDITETKKLAFELQLKEKNELLENLRTERLNSKNIEESNKRYNILLLDSPFAISILKGEKMIITLANDSIKKLWGKGNDIEGKALFDVLAELKTSAFPELLRQVYLTGKPFYGTEMHTPLIRNKKLEDVYFSFVYQPYREADETISGVTIIAYDVTDQVKIKNELIEAKTIAVSDKKIAEIAVKAKQLFLSNMSHEIRTPMNSIIGFTNALLKTSINKEQKDFLTAIKLSGDALIVLINDILDLAKVDEGKMTFEKKTFNIRKAISAIKLLFEQKLEDKNLKFHIHYDPKLPSKIVGDELRLRQIIINLIENAIKFTEKGKIEFRIQLLSENKESIRILFSLKDTGIGIPKEKQKQIFDNFEQASENTTRLYGGTGLGLAIVKKLIELQGGKISLVSSPKKGSTFLFELDFIKEKGQIEDITVEDNSTQDLLSNPPKTDSTDKIILVVEDNALNRLLMKTLLIEYGCKYDFAEDGEIALNMIKSKKYDLILMDIQMPVMNGFEATSYIREKLKSNVPILALTADVTDLDIRKSKEVGMNDYITKPIDEKILFNKMDIYLNTSTNE